MSLALPHQRSQLLSVPASGLLVGLLTALPYVRVLGWPLALAAGVLLALLLGTMSAWVAYRSDGGARHARAGAALYLLFLVPFVAGMYLALAQMAGLGRWVGAAWVVGAVTVVLPVLGMAWHTRKRLLAEGEAGPWARQHLDLRAGVLLPGAPAPAGSARRAMAPWMVGALAVNLPLAWRLLGGGDTGLMVLGLALLVTGVVWAGAAQVGPALGSAGFVMAVERRTGQRLRHPDWADVQALRRGHWLARWCMRDS